MLLASLGLHLAVVLIFAFGLLPQKKLDLRPVYYIDLTTMPVKSPQAGRPDARPPAPKPEKAPAPSPAPEPLRPEPKSAPKPKPEPEPAKPQPAPKKSVAPAPKPSPKPQASTAKERAEADRALQERMEKLRVRKEIEDLKRSLEGIAAKDTRQAAGADAPLGLPTGRGAEAGVDEQTWISAFIKQNWNLSPHQVRRRDLWARTALVFDAEGALIDYKITRPSGEEIFDESVRRAILKVRQLPFTPERRLEIVVEFNLKDLEK